MTHRFLLNLFLLGALLPACGGGQGKPAHTGVAVKPDLKRLSRKCDDSMGLCRLSLLPDLKESKAGKLSLLAIILQPKEGGAALTQAVLGFQVSSKKVRYRDCQQLIISSGSGPALTRPVRYDQALQRGSIVEGITAEVATGELVRLSQAEKVSVDLCGQERVLRPDEKALIAELVRRWRQK